MPYVFDRSIDFPVISVSVKFLSCYLPLLAASTRSMRYLTEQQRVGQEGSLLQELERNTWPEIERLTTNEPGAGIHFQRRHSSNDCFIQTKL